MTTQWNIIVNERFGAGAVIGKTLDDDALPRRCRFCGRCEPEVTFREKAHVIPVGLGNRTLLSNGECDGCNHGYGEPIETALQTFLGAMRVAAGIRGRRGFALFKPTPKSAAIRWNEPNIIRVDECGEDDALVVQPEPDGEGLTITWSMRPDIEGIARALARMALFFLSTEHHSHVLRWVKRELHWAQASFRMLFLCEVAPDAGALVLHAPPPDLNDQSIVVVLVVARLALALALPPSDWSAPSTPWDEVLAPLEILRPMFPASEFKVRG